jgi:hypothetical protein
MTISTASELASLRDRLVRPFYMAFLHGNLRFRDTAEAGALERTVSLAAREASDSDLSRLLDEPEWRGRLAAAWFIALTGRADFAHRLGELLLASELCFAGQGYCLALAMIGSQAAEDYLRDYLLKYLPPAGRHYDQQWAIGALAHLRRSAPNEFIVPSLWADPGGDLSPHEGIADFSDLLDYLTRHKLIPARSTP